MSDPVHQWLAKQLQLAQGQQQPQLQLQPQDASEPADLWIADENALDSLHILKSCTHPLKIISNRFDVAQPLTDSGLDCEFTDFDFSKITDNSLNRIYYRVSKEKPVVHHVINQAYRCLCPEGELVIAGLKNEGTKTYLGKIKKHFGGTATLSKNNTVYTGIIAKAAKKADSPTPLDDKDYSDLRPTSEIGNIQLFSKPGQFGWNKADQGSAFLIEHLQGFLDALKKPPTSMLDLGCGYGYLTLMSRQLPLNKRVATDNNAAAVNTARYNFEKNDIDCQVIADDCAESITERFDIILCNPPFHQGFSTDSRLTEKFLLNTQKRLNKTGAALFVVNQFIGLESKAKQYFGKVEILARNKSFKLLTLKL